MNPSSHPARPAVFKQYQDQIETALQDAIQRYSYHDSRLSQAMTYSTIAGGKYIRPILVLATAASFGVASEVAMPVACAVEMIHSYSLIHDDLPSMDNDELRRGRPTCHIAYDEATAILAGDALQSLAFEILANLPDAVAAEQKIRMIQILTKASGSRGMVAGQAIDLHSVGQALDLPRLEHMHQHKTGALITASVQLGALCSAHASEHQRSQLTDYAHAIGLAFQVQDDILDITSDTSTLGKPQGADMALNKPTYPALLGLEGAQGKLKALHQQALQALDGLQDKDTSTLKDIADYIVARIH